MIKFAGIVALVSIFLLIWLSPFSPNLEKTNFNEKELAIVAKYQQLPLNVASFSNSEINKFILNNIATHFDLKINFIEYSNFAKALEAVKKGEAKLISNVSYSKEREEALAFSSSITVDQGHLFSHDANMSTYSINKKIAVEYGTSWKSIAYEKMPHNEIIEFHDIQEAVELFKNHEVDAVLSSDKYYEKFANLGAYPINIIKKFNVTSTSIAGTKNETEDLLTIISKYAESKEFKQAFAEFENNFYNSANKNVLNKRIKELNFDKDKTYNIAFLGSPPFTIMNKNKYSGILPEYFEQIAKLAGIKYKITDKKTYYALNNGEIDIAFPLMYNERLNHKFSLSSPIYTKEEVIVKRESGDYKFNTNIVQLVFEKIGVITGSFDEEFFSKVLPKKNISLYPTMNDLISGLKNEEVDYIALNKTIFLQYVIQSKDFSIRIDNNIGVFNSGSYHAVFAKTEEGKALREIFSIASRLVKFKTFENKYIHEMNYEKYYKYQSNKIVFLLLVLFLIFIGICLLAIRQHKLARTDSLCNVLNRRALHNDFNTIAKTNTIVYFNLNSFREINNVYGHRVGDEILQAFANHNYLNHKIKIYRIGGDEFISVLNFDKQKVSALSYAESFCENKFFSKITGTSYTVRATAIVLPGKFAHEKLDDNLSILDIATKEIKSQNQLIHEISFNQFNAYLMRLNFRKTLKDSILAKNLYAQFQPIIDITTGKVVGIETLSRLKIKNKHIPVNIYFEQAKILRLESNIDIISLEWAQMCCNKLLDLGISVIFSVNASEQTLAKIGRGTIKLKNFNIPKDLLRIEILEDVVIDEKSMEYVKIIINEGYSVAIDDFGAGSTSLKYVKEPMFKVIKIDKSLVPIDFESNEDGSQTVLKSQIDMLFELGKSIIVEGVEEYKQVEYLQNLGVKLIQGYYYAKPMELDEVVKFVQITNGSLNVQS